MRNTQIVFVPEWIRNSLLRRGLSLETVLDIEKMVSIFSFEDLATIVALDENSRIFSRDRVSGNNLLPFIEIWQKSAKSNKCKNLISDVAALAKQESFWLDTLKRLTLDGQTTDELARKETFEVSLLGDQGIVVVIKEGYSIEHHEANSLALFKAAVKKLLIFMEYHEAMELVTGRTYIESLQR